MHRANQLDVVQPSSFPPNGVVKAEIISIWLFFGLRGEDLVSTALRSRLPSPSTPRKLGALGRESYAEAGVLPGQAVSAIFDGGIGVRRSQKQHVTKRADAQEPDRNQGDLVRGKAGLIRFCGDKKPDSFDIPFPSGETLRDLVRRGLISPEDAFVRAVDRDSFAAGNGKAQKATLRQVGLGVAPEGDGR